MGRSVIVRPLDADPGPLGLGQGQVGAPVAHEHVAVGKAHRDRAAERDHVVALGVRVGRRDADRLAPGGVPDDLLAIEVPGPAAVLRGDGADARPRVLAQRVGGDHHVVPEVDRPAGLALDAGWLGSGPVPAVRVRDDAMEREERVGALVARPEEREQAAVEEPDDAAVEERDLLGGAVGDRAGVLPGRAAVARDQADHVVADRARVVVGLAGVGRKEPEPVVEFDDGARDVELEAIGDADRLGVGPRPPAVGRFEEHRLDGQEAAGDGVDRKALVRVLAADGDENDRAVGQRRGERAGI